MLLLLYQVGLSFMTKMTQRDKGPKLFTYKFCHCSDAQFTFPLPPFSSEVKEKQWLSSRWALKQALSQLAPEVEIKNYLDLQTSKYHSLKGNPHLLVSLSHSDQFGCAIVANRSDIVGVGIDIEKIDRPIKEGIQKFFKNGNDKLSPPSFLNKIKIHPDLPLWCAKEAAFKAFSPLWPAPNKTLTLKDIWIKKGHFGIGKTHLGRIQWGEQDDYLVALAFLYSGDSKTWRVETE
jgi:phosphopantetheinyl transferase (holo-ACP synthase)